jgi:hypothetical protein
MRVEISFFENLFNLKKLKEVSMNTKTNDNGEIEQMEKQDDNEWIQEYEVIYQSYALER